MATLPNSELAQNDAAVELPDLITVDRYRDLPDDPSRVYELHLGEVVALSHPKPWHWRIQHRLVEILKPRLAGFVVGMEFAFRTLREFDLRAADVAALTKERYDAMAPDVDLFGAPELVIEIKSPSNTRRELQIYTALCLNSGSIQFWVLERRTKTVNVYHRDGSKQTFGLGESIPLDAFGGDSLPVAEIFLA